MTVQATGKSRPNRAKRLGILNQWGDVWTPETFETEAEARAYIAHFWRKHPDIDQGQFKVTLVRVTVSAIRPRTPQATSKGGSEQQNPDLPLPMTGGDHG